MELKRDESFGAIPLVQEGNTWRVFLIQSQKGKYWGFPKGHKEKDEDAKTAAIRELREETSLGIKRFLTSDSFIEEYQFHKEGHLIQKKVEYFLVEAVGVYALDQKEVQDGRWFSLKEAALQLTYPEAKNILSQVEKVLQKLE